MSTLNADDAGGSGFNAMRPGILYAYARNPYFFLSLLQSSKVNKTKEKTGDEKYSCHSLDEVSRMIHNTLSAYESKVDFFFVKSSYFYKIFLTETLNELNQNYSGSQHVS